MALKPTIYKLKIALSDLDREVYDTLNITIACHPSETLERMMVRVLAYCFNASEQLVICKGLSDTEEPDLWAHTLDGSLRLWIDVGEPAVDRIKKASRVASAVRVYCFNTKSSTWWELGRSKMAELKASIYRFQWKEIQALAALVQRTMDLSITITGNSAYVATELGECELALEVLQEV
ncbi:MAG: YaeQ family protein [Pseudohongiella sp.]|nr:YaeQ family protein [Pseudohongiella sp.]